MNSPHPDSADELSHLPAAELVQLLREFGRGSPEWRVCDPGTRSYCISFGFADGTPDPKRAAQAWLRDYKRDFPDGKFAAFEVQEVLACSEQDLLLVEAARRLEALVVERGQLGALVQSLQARVDVAIAQLEQLHAERAPAAQAQGQSPAADVFGKDPQCFNAFSKDAQCFSFACQDLQAWIASVAQRAADHAEPQLLGNGLAPGADVAANDDLVERRH